MYMNEITLKQTSASLNVSYITLMNWIKSGELNGRQTLEGKRTVWRIPTEEVERIRAERIQWHQEQIDMLRKLQPSQAD